VYLRSVGFANATVGWVGTLTATHRLLSTRDGGASWQLVTNLPAGAPPAICGISVVDANTLYASGTNFPDAPAAIIKTTNGGATWTAIDMSAHAAILVDIHFKNQNEGWVVGGRDDVGRPMAQRKRDDVKPVLLHTTNGGATWTDRLASIRRFCPRGEWGWKIQALDAQTMFASLENMLDGAILRSDNGGQTWRRIPINDRQRNANLGDLIVASMPVCINQVRAMIEAYDRYFGDGEGEAFFMGPYLDVLPSAVTKWVRDSAK